MSLTKTVGIVAATTFASLAMGAVETSNDTLAQIAELKAELATLKAQNGDQWLTEQRASEIRGIVQDVLADSETRQSLQASGATSGYNGGFFIGSADGNNSLKINILEQVRWTYNNRSGITGGNGNGDSTWGFENKRTRFTFSGNVVDSTWTYNFSTYFAYDDNTEFTGSLANAFVDKDFGNGFSLTAGQFQDPSGMEQSIDAGNLQFIERSTVSYIFNLGYTQGAMVNYSSDMFRLSATYNNGESTANGSWGAGSPTSEWAFASRFEVKCAGNWDQFADQQSWRGEEAGFLVGAGLAWAQSNDGLDTDTYTFTVDGTYDFGGGNIAGAFFYSDDSAASNNPTGYTVGGGFFVSDDMELVARYEFADMDTGGTDDTMSNALVGWNWYFSKNVAKLNTSFGYAFDSLNNVSFSAPGAQSNWLQDATGEDGQWTLQAQLSFSF